MSNIIFFAFTIFLLLNLKKIDENKRESLKILYIYSFFSLIILIALTGIHIFTIKNTNIYTRYVSPILPVFFIFGTIGIKLFTNIKRKNPYIVNNLLYIIALLVLFFVIIFPIEEYKLINNIDLTWIYFLTHNYFFDINLFSLTKIFILITTFLLIIGTKFKFKKLFNFHKINLKSKSTFYIFFIIINILILTPNVYQMTRVNEYVEASGINKPGIWFYENDSDAYVVIEDTYTAFSGGGMKIDDWGHFVAYMYYWMPNNHIKIFNNTKIKELLFSNQTDVDYIISTHDLTNYFPSEIDFYLMKEVSPMKKQNLIDWHIYKVK
jgi:hypothetical protein